ncbi:MAG: hypothetical protein ACYC2U_01990 [Candidatus Amoebophilus sp.]
MYIFIDNTAERGAAIYCSKNF